MIEFVLDNGFPVDGMDVQRAAEQVLAYPDPEALELLFERGIINSKSRTTRGRSLLDTLASRGVEGVAITATLDILIKHGVDINGASDSPLHRIVGRGMCAYQQNSPWRREVMLRRLLDRGADPLRRCEIHGSPLETAAKDGEQGLLKIMLKTLSQRHVRLDELQPILSLAEKGAEDMRHYMIPPILRRFYWRRRREVELEEAPS
ncbi:hypothetical protein N7468_001073 [Penicillium chermesinum]|uniref:Ankyrin repeat protein n=1 Tax=Penicillium chermesinum TaxID=63820 RepID=A0A9W9PG23_9EURO|nr:uncharacterized protein N7468_001073 [Penicillium chermesinum]KAJ5246090.1 hypothetical protein N7468_001073 [Penicillium chermesinum]